MLTTYKVSISFLMSVMNMFKVCLTCLQQFFCTCLGYEQQSRHRQPFLQSCVLVPQMKMAGSLAPHSACQGMLALRPRRAARSLALAPQAVAAVEAPPSKPDGVMGQGPIIINGQVLEHRYVAQSNLSAVNLRAS